MIWRYATLISFFCLLVWILLWKAWLDPPYPAALLLLLLLTPLLLTLRGLLYARYAAHALLTLMTPFYFALGISDAYAEPATRWYGCGLLFFSLMLFTGSIGFIRASRSNGAKLDKSPTD